WRKSRIADVRTLPICESSEAAIVASMAKSTCSRSTRRLSARSPSCVEGRLPSGSGWRHDRVRWTIREPSMAKSRAEMMELVGKLLAEYAEFQLRRPDLPQGDLRDLSEQELDFLVTEFHSDAAEAR